MKIITICADDFAQNELISHGIIDLAERQRINAISCLVSVDGWPKMAYVLSGLRQTCSVGLHVNFTFGQALSSAWKKRHGHQFQSLPRLISHAYLRQLDASVVTAELEAQWDAFVAATNGYPDFIDGHQHCHQLPVIRDCLLALYARKNLTMPCRSTARGYRDMLSWHHFPKRHLIGMLGGVTFKTKLGCQGISTNTSFSGIYPFKHAQNYRVYFKQFLSESQSGGLIMCHPGQASSDETDPLYASRHYEMDYFLSQGFLDDLNEYGFQLQRGDTADDFMTEPPMNSIPKDKNVFDDETED